MMRFSDMREKSFIRAEAKVRNLLNSMTVEEWHDLFLSTTTMAPIR
jgi:hypothetical protein